MSQTQDAREVWRKLYQQSRGISYMGDDFMEPWEHQYAEQVVQEVYSTLEDLALCEGVPGVAEWIRDHLQKEYHVTLKYDPELDELK